MDSRKELADLIALVFAHSDEKGLVDTSTLLAALNERKAQRDLNKGETK